MFLKIKQHASYRHIVQLIFALIVFYIGITFIVFVNQISENTLTSLNRSAGVEAFLPLSALVGLKVWISTGGFDPIHPAGLVILILAIAVSLFLKRTFCSWICPLGTLSEGLAEIGKAIFGHNFKIPKVLDYLLRSLKYIVLAFFIVVIFGVMSGEEGAAFVISPFNMMADIQMLRYFEHLGLLGFIVIDLFLLLSIFYENFWCRYFCPYGALLGLISLLSLFKISRNPTTCIQCGRCTKSCPNQILVSEADRVWSPECNSCLKCVQQCPVEDTLTYKARIVSWSLKPRNVAIALVLIWLLAVIAAKLSGHWETKITMEMYRALAPK